MNTEIISLIHHSIFNNVLYKGYILNDTAVLFNTKYLGTIPNDASGRVSLWGDIVDLNKALEKIRAIEGFDSKSVTVEKGDTKKSVVVGQTVTPTNAMEQLYMTCIVA